MLSVSSIFGTASQVRRFTVACICALPAITLAATTQAAPTHPAASKTYKVKLPPPADLHYQITARQSGLSIKGTGLVRWSWAGNRFSVTSQSRADLLGKVLEAKSEGEIDAFGLAPTSFIDKRLGKNATTTTFDRASKTIQFSASSATYPMTGGEQDRNSIIWQLISVARGAGKAFKQGSKWQFFVAGQRDGELWTFEVGKTEKVRTAMGTLDAVYVVRVPAANSKGQKLDIWLAPAMQWYPAKLRFTETDGDFIEQTLESISKS